MITGHPTLSDWFFLLAAVGFVLALLLLVLHVPSSPAEAPQGRSWGRYSQPLTLVALALVALGLLVL